jgi:hypothetical protein
MLNDNTSQSKIKIFGMVVAGKGGVNFPKLSRKSENPKRCHRASLGGRNAVGNQVVSVECKGKKPDFFKRFSNLQAEV